MIHLGTRQNYNLTVYGITILFFVLSLWGIMNHELWLDEAHHYLLARDSSSFSDLLINTRYEGHPILWNLILHWITRLTTNPIWMQLLHISIMTLTVGVFLKKAPFSWIFKLLFIFGYFMFYEYNIISRNYNLGVLFIFLACSLYNKRTTRFILISALLGFASNSHAVFLILASSIMLLIVFERFQTEKLNLSKNTWIGIGVFGSLALLSLYQIIPPSDTSFFDRGEQLSLFQKAGKSITPFFKSLFLLPDVTLDHFWNSHILVNHSKSIAAIVAMGSLSIPYLLFYKNRSLLLYMYFGIFATAGFFFITMMNATRYYGVLYLFLITALWFEHYRASSGSELRTKKSFSFLKKIRFPIIYTILGLHFISGIYAFTMDISRPFTTAEQTFEYLKENHLLEKTIATKACNGTPLSAYIDKPIYFTTSNSFESFCHFNRPSLQYEEGNTSSLKSIKQLLKDEADSIIFITYEPFFDSAQNKVWLLEDKELKVTYLTQFTGSIIKKGNHYLYEISSH
ncbi:hypothetical protein [Winogradskyella sp. A3E31]|uniref:hypothetical protein n=1 Tax=Winogradskyella sp. A3E31 TaxID=3349637 RepID=UPI00398AD4C2